MTTTVIGINNEEQCCKNACSESVCCANITGITKSSRICFCGEAEKTIADNATLEEAKAAAKERLQQAIERFRNSF